VQKIAFQLGGFSLHWYGVLVAAGFLVGLWTASRRAVRNGLAAEWIVDMGPWLIVGTVVGARTLYVISYWREFFSQQPLTEIFMVQHGGLIFYGGLVGASLACILYSRLKKLPLWKVADALAPSIALGHAFGRIGCLMNGCCYGRECHLPWAIHFPLDHDTHGAAVHPVQIYEAALNLALYVGLATLYRRKKFEGQVFALYLLAFPVLRSTVEFFRGDYPVRYLGGWATPAHLVSVGIFAAGAMLYWQLRSSKTTPPSP
jgi:phosphatidylglycerol:prolipoprotein diacylglycerol transferase